MKMNNKLTDQINGLTIEIKVLREENIKILRRNVEIEDKHKDMY